MALVKLRNVKKSNREQVQTKEHTMDIYARLQPTAQEKGREIRVFHLCSRKERKKSGQTLPEKKAKRCLLSDNKVGSRVVLKDG